MKVIAEKVKYHELKRGDLASYEDQSFWDNVLSIDNIVHLNLLLILNQDPENPDEDLYRITIVKDEEKSNDRA